MGALVREYGDGRESEAGDVGFGRIDLVFGDGRVKAVNAQRIGTDVLMPSGLWPSYHAGMVATVRIRKPARILESAEVHNALQLWPALPDFP